MTHLTESLLALRLEETERTIRLSQEIDALERSAALLLGEARAKRKLLPKKMGVRRALMLAATGGRKCRSDVVAIAQQLHQGSPAWSFDSSLSELCRDKKILTEGEVGVRVYYINPEIEDALLGKV